MSAATLLVIDDEPSARQTVEALLFAEGHQLLFASSASEGMALLESAHPDLILCDVMMPGMDGFELCRRVKAHDRWRLAPVILLTALDGVDDQVRGLEAGADDFVSKPLVGAVLRARTRAMLRVRGHYLTLIPPTDSEELLRARRERRIAEAHLTEREIEVLQLLLLGRGHEEIALILSISERTSRFHQGNVLRKLGAESRYDLIRLFA